MSTKLDDLKKVAESHMQKEVDIMEMVMELDNNENSVKNIKNMCDE